MPEDGLSRPEWRASLVLASQSPRRRQLLSEHGVEHRAIHPGVDDAELEPGRVRPGEWVAALAYLKAVAGLLLLRARGETGPLVVLGADTACVKGERLIGTPLTAEEAEEILRSLEDGEHDVVTGVALVGQSGPGSALERTLFCDTARVRVGRLGQERIRAYVESGEWRGKAGGYNLLERIGAGWPIQYDGDPTTVMGLPMQKLLRRLSRPEHAHA